MKTKDASKTFGKLDQCGQAVFTIDELRNIFPDRSEKTFTAGLSQLVKKACCSARRAVSTLIHTL